MSIEQQSEQAKPAPPDICSDPYSDARAVANAHVKQHQQKGLIVRPTQIETEEEQDDHFDDLDTFHQSACHQLGLPWLRPIEDSIVAPPVTLETEGDLYENALSLEQGFRLLSSYPLPETGETLWIMTEHDRSATTILTPAEY